MLTVGMVVSNVAMFTMSCNHSMSGKTCTLQCDQNVRLVFDSIQIIHIRKVNFFECFGSTVMNTENVFLSNNSFTGSVHVISGSALEIINSAALLNDCSFTRFLYGTYRWIDTNVPHSTSTVLKTEKWIGGALIANHSNITIVKGNFTENRAQIGGAIYAENGTRVTITKSKFIYNAANSSYRDILEQTAAAGALYATNNCSIFISDSHFDNNLVYHGYRLGGTVAVYQGMIQIIRSVLVNSMADNGAVVYLSESRGEFNQTNVSSNSAVYDGGALYIVNSSINLSYSVFFNNKAIKKGGVILLSQSIMNIQNCIFVKNSASGVNGDGGVIYVKMKSVWSAKSCQFNNNSATFGAVMHIDNTNQRMQVERCTFHHNKADADGGVFYFNNDKKLNSTQISASTIVNITQSNFYGNEAKSKGGVYYKPYNNKLVIKDSDNVYKRNQAENGGVMHISGSVLKASNTYAALNAASKQGIVLLSNSRISYSGAITFDKNLGSVIIGMESEICFHGKMNFTANENRNSTGRQEGGAITATLSVIIFSGQGIFMQNRASGYGGAICSVNSIIHVLGDTRFFNNMAARGGGIYLYQSDLLCKHNLHLIDNNASISGGGMHFRNSFIRISSQGSLLFTRNSAKLGGGIFLTRSSNINVQGTPHPGIDTETPWAVTIRFIHNLAAVHGGGIYIDDNANPLSCIAESDPESPSAGLENGCFFQVARISSINTSIKYMYFNLNEAVNGGPDLYGGLFDRCTPIYRLFNHGKFGSVSYLLSFSNITQVSWSVSSQPVRVCFCRNNQLDCDYQPSQRNVTKGQQFIIELVAVDQVNNMLAATINALTSSSESRVGLGQQSQPAQNVCTALTYEVYSTNPSEELVLYAEGPCQNANISSRSIHIHFGDCQCPAGFMVSPEDNNWNCRCICHKQLQPYLKGCNSSSLLLVRNSQAWMDTVSSKTLLENAVGNVF